MQDIQAFASRIAEQFRPQRIVLFGSCARGEYTPDSDVDLLVVLPFEGKSWKMAARIRELARPRFPTDILVRTPGQVAQRLAQGDTFLRDVLRQGVTLYEA